MDIRITIGLGNIVTYRNFDLNNLIVVSDAEELIMNRNNLFKEDTELTKAGVAVAKLLDKVNKRKKDL